MASAATPSRLGQANASGSATALFLQKFSGEVLGAFYANTIMFPGRHQVRTIDSGKSASFSYTGSTVAAYHTPGNELVGDVINHNEKVISIDGLLAASAFIAEIDDLENHYDVRGKYAEALGQALAQKADQQLLQLGVLGARASAIVTGGNGGSVLTNASYGTVATTLAAGIFSSAQKFDEKNIGNSGRFVVVRPAQYFLLAQELDLINKDWGGMGAYSDGSVMRIAGLEIVKSNNLPITNISADSPAPVNTYHANFSTTVAVAMTPDALATVKLKDLVMATDWDPRRLGWLMTARYAMGHGYVRPECCVEFKTS